MRVLIWLILLFALAVGFTQVGQYSPGYAIFVYPPYRIELSLTLFAALLLAIIVIADLFIRGAIATLTLPSRARQFRQHRRQQLGQVALLNALRAEFDLQYDQAETAARRAIELNYQPRLAALLAARVATAVNAVERSEHWTELAQKYPHDN